MKFGLLALCALTLLFAQEQEGNFDIRFEPTAKLQTRVQVPFQVTVNDALHKPVADAKVTLEIQTTDNTNVKVFPAPAINPGVYVAKPVFPSSGEWNVYVEVHRANAMSARTIQFSVPE